MKYENMNLIDYNKIDVGKMPTSQFTTLLKHAKTREFSSFANFTMMFQGFDLHLNGKKIAKWEAFYLSSKNPDNILTGKSKIKAIKR